MKQLLTTVLVVLSVVVATAATATTVVKLNFDQLVEVSDLIVVGEVAKVDAVVRDGRVFPHIDIKVRETLKGDATRKLEIVHIGGRTENLVTRVAGMPSFGVGELALLFLERPKKVNHYVVTGLSQGKMSLKEAEDGTLHLQRSVSNLNTVDLKRRTFDLEAPKQPQTKLALPSIDTLDDARARIAELLDPSSTSKTEE